MNVDLSGTDFANANLSNSDLTNADMTQASLANAELLDSMLNDANLSRAVVKGASFFRTGITKEQLCSTASYEEKNLAGIDLGSNHLAGWDFAGQNLADASLHGANRTDADLSGAVVLEADLGFTTNFGFAEEQLYLTASYEEKNLQGIRFGGNDLTGWNFQKQNLANADVSNSTVTQADFSAAVTRGARLAIAGAITANTILPDGRIDGLALTNGQTLVIRDYDGDPRRGAEDPGPLPILVARRMIIDEGGALQLVFDDDAWYSTISFEPVIPMTLGGTLALTFRADTALEAQTGRAVSVFDWTGVAPTGEFQVASPELAWDTSALYTNGEVTFLGLLPGNTNGNGIVNIDDLNAVRNNFGAEATPSPVPEPWGLLIGLLGIVCFEARRRMCAVGRGHNTMVRDTPLCVTFFQK